MDNIPSSSPTPIADPSPILYDYHYGRSAIFIVVVIVVIVVVGKLLLRECRRERLYMDIDFDLEATNPPPEQQQQQLPVVRAQYPPPQHHQQQLPIDEGRVKEISVGCTECVICLEEYANDEVGVTLKPCGHRFHMACIAAWLTQAHGCPICGVGVVKIYSNVRARGEDLFTSKSNPL